MTKFKLPKTTQCAKCPWRKDVNPYDIPDGYNRELHQALECTIAPTHDEQGNDIVISCFTSKIGQPIKMMACHEAATGFEYPCIGWLNHQIGIGNNVQLRLHMMNCSNLDEVVLCGEQHENFQDTLPASSLVLDLDYFGLKDYDPSDHDFYF